MPAAEVVCAGVRSSRVEGEAFLQLLRILREPRLCTVPGAMAPRQVDLRACWHTAGPGRLTAWQQAFTCGLREASKELYGGHVAVTWIASKLRKTDATGKAYSQDAPEQGSLSEFFRKIDADPESRGVRSQRPGPAGRKAGESHVVEGESGGESGGQAGESRDETGKAPTYRL